MPAVALLLRGGHRRAAAAQQRPMTLGGMSETMTTRQNDDQPAPCCEHAARTDRRVVREHAPPLWMEAAEIGAILVAAGGEGYTINASHKAGVPSVLAEVSGNGLWGEETVGRLSDGIARVMHYLGMISEPAPPLAASARIVTMWVPAAPCDGLWYAAKDLSEAISKGDVLGEIRDVFGKVLATIRSQKDGFILYRLTSLSVNEGEALLGVGTPLAPW